MKKALSAAVFLGLAISLGASPLLVESYQTGQVNIPEGMDSTVTVTEFSFLVDTNCYVQFIAAGLVSYGRIWLELDGDSLFPVDRQNFQVLPTGVSVTYVTLLLKGNHNIRLMCGSYINIYDPTVCQNAYLQALIFLPDTPPAVTEQPDVEPGVQTSSVISQGPYVSAPGASLLVDASGRIIENAITDGKVQISTLPPGTYFAKDEERTVVKIVKVE